MPALVLPVTPVETSTFSMSLVDVEGRTTTITTAVELDGTQRANLVTAVAGLTNGVIFQTEERSSVRYTADPTTAAPYDEAFACITDILTLVFGKWANSEHQTTTLNIPAFDATVKVNQWSEEVDLDHAQIQAIAAIMSAADGWNLERAYISRRKYVGPRGNLRTAAAVEPQTGSPTEGPGMNPLNP